MFVVRILHVIEVPTRFHGAFCSHTALQRGPHIVWFLIFHKSQLSPSQWNWEGGYGSHIIRSVLEHRRTPPLLSCQNVVTWPCQLPRGAGYQNLFYFAVWHVPPYEWGSATGLKIIKNDNENNHSGLCFKLRIYNCLKTMYI